MSQTIVSMKALTVALSAVVMIATMAAPALAIASETGSNGCATGQEVWVRSYTKGDTKHYYPTTSTLQKTYTGGNYWMTRTTDTNYRSATWKVTATIALDHPGTYGYCVPNS